MKFQYMFNNAKIKTSFILALITIVFFISCKKNEEPPVPIGSAIKYTGEVLGSVDSALQKSPYTLFFAAWKKAGLDTLISMGKASALTIYAPTDSAFMAAGYTAAKINNSSKADLDTLLSYHVVLGTYVDSTLTTLNGTSEATTVLKSANPPQSVPQYTTFGPTTPYTYALFISANNGFSINGKQVKTSQKLIHAYHAIIYPINQVLQRPTQDIYAILNTDPRFKFLMASYQMSDSLLIANIGFLARSDVAALPLTVNTSNITLFAPTDDVFMKFLGAIYHKNTGDVTIQDLRNYQNRAYGQQINFNSLSPIDTIISPYMINYSPGRNVESYQSPTRPLVTGSTWLYNDLLYNSSAIDGYVITPADQYGDPAVFIDLDFVPSGTTVTLKRHTANISPPVNIVQRDIMTTNGVIHIVDGLLLPNPPQQ